MQIQTELNINWNKFEEKTANSKKNSDDWVQLGSPESSPSVLDLFFKSEPGKIGSFARLCAIVKVRACVCMHVTRESAEKTVYVYASCHWCVRIRMHVFAQSIEFAADVFLKLTV